MVKHTFEILKCLHHNIFKSMFNHFVNAIREGVAKSLLYKHSSKGVLHKLAMKNL